MKKIKKVWEENKILMVLAIILIVCLIIFGVVAITYFYGSSRDVYGNRLDITKDVPLDSNINKKVESELKKNASVKSVKINVKGRIVYINVKFSDEVDMDSAKKTAESVVALFSEKELDVYELEFTISTSSYTLMGARNVSGSDAVVWNNYNIKESTEEE